MAEPVCALLCWVLLPLAEWREDRDGGQWEGLLGQSRDHVGTLILPSKSQSQSPFNLFGVHCSCSKAQRGRVTYSRPHSKFNTGPMFFPLNPSSGSNLEP